MKNLTKHIVILAAFMAYNQAFSQELKDTNSFKTHKNEVSLELLQLLNGVYQISYERSFFDNFSASLAAGYKGKSGLIGFSGIDKPKLKTGDIFYTGFQIIPEVRYYLPKTSKTALTVFYIGAYYKYSNYKSRIRRLLYRHRWVYLRFGIRYET